MTPKLSYLEVMERVEAEREFQDACVSKYFAAGQKAGATDPSRAIPAEIMMIEEYLSYARNAWVHDRTDDRALDCIRKIAAMAVRCLENHGCPERGLDCTYVVPKE